MSGNFFSPAKFTTSQNAPSSVAPSPKPEMTTLSIRSEEHTSELQSHSDLVCRLLLEKKKKSINNDHTNYEQIVTNTRHEYKSNANKIYEQQTQHHHQVTSQCDDTHNVPRHNPQIRDS